MQDLIHPQTTAEKKKEAPHFTTTQLKATNKKQTFCVHTGKNKSLCYYNNKYHNCNDNDDEDQNYSKQSPECKDNTKNIKDIKASEYHTKIITRTTIILQHL